MGSLTSTPKIAERAVANTIKSPQQSSPVIDEKEDKESKPQAIDKQKMASKARKKSLLARSRSRYGTIATSFHGILSQNNLSQAMERKTLLGQ